MGEYGSGIIQDEDFVDVWPAVPGLLGMYDVCEI